MAVDHVERFPEHFLGNIQLLQREKPPVAWDRARVRLPDRALHRAAVGLVVGRAVLHELSHIIVDFDAVKIQCFAEIGNGGIVNCR